MVESEARSGPGEDGGGAGAEAAAGAESEAGAGAAAAGGAPPPWPAVSPVVASKEELQSNMNANISNCWVSVFKHDHNPEVS